MPERGGYREPRYVAQITAQILRTQADRAAREAALPPKVGRDPHRPWHPVFNPSVEEEAAQEKLIKQSARVQRERTLGKAQGKHWADAIRLIRAGKVESYAALGRSFQKTQWEQRSGQGEHYSPRWAYQLVNKMLLRKVFTLDEIERLIPDQTSPFKYNHKP